MDKNKLKKELRAKAKTATPAELNQLLRIARCIPNNYRAVHFKEINATAYLLDKEIDHPTLKDVKSYHVRFFKNDGFKLTSEFSYRYRNEQNRTQRIAEEVERMKAKLAERTEAKTKGHDLTLSTVMYGSWGYEQTNVEFYEVTKIVGKTMVEIRELKVDKDFDGSMSGKCIPLVGQYTDEAPKRVKVKNNNSVRLHDHCTLTPANYTEVGGVKVYDAKGWTSYA